MESIEALAARNLLKLCRDLFNCNVIGTDFKDVSFSKNGEGIRVKFTVSWDAFGKTGGKAHDAYDCIFRKEHP